MVQEVRRIIFSQDELMAAFECYRRVTPDFLPEGRVVYCKPTDEMTVQVTLETNIDGTAQLQECTIRGVDVLKPLIRFCIEHRIMLPKEGRKTVALQHTSLVICIALTVHVDLPKYVAPAEGEHASLWSEIEREPAQALA